LPHTLVVLSLALMAAGFGVLAHLRTAASVAKGRAGADERLVAVRGTAWIMIGVLLANALAFAKLALIDAEINSPVPATRWDLITTHGSVLLGTGSLMGLVVLALGQPAVWAEPTPMLASTRLMVVIAERLLPRFWWAAVGLGALFGVAAGVGPVLFLAGELTLFWLVGRISLAVQHRRSS